MQAAALPLKLWLLAPAGPAYPQGLPVFQVCSDGVIRDAPLLLLLEQQGQALQLHPFCTQLRVHGRQLVLQLARLTQPRLHVLQRQKAFAWVS